MAGDDVMVRIAERLERERAALAEQLAAEKRARKEAEENWANMSDALTACEAENKRLRKLCKEALRYVSPMHNDSDQQWLHQRLCGAVQAAQEKGEDDA